MNRSNSKPPVRSGRRLVEVLLVIFLLVVVTAVLMPSLRMAKQIAIRESMQVGADYGFSSEPMQGEGQPGPPDTADKVDRLPVVTQAQIKSFVATIDLTPSLSVGTAQPESIYEAVFKASIEARNPAAAKGECEIQLPLPPQVISLSDLNVSLNGDPSEGMFIRNGYLVWRGELDADTPAAMEITYRAVGKGIYTLEVPPGKIVDTFEVTLTANGSDLRLMELSLQPEPPVRKDGKTVYTWKYKRLMIGRPIAMDILGLAPLDRLGELVWLGPISVLVFGLLVTMVTLAFRPEALDKWMLLLIVGLFAAAYPLMYYAQEFMSLGAAVVLACVAMVAILSVRAVTLLGPRVGVLGVSLVAACVLTLTMLAAINPRMQGILLTIEAIGALVAAAMLLPRTELAPPRPPMAETVPTHPPTAAGAGPPIEPADREPLDRPTDRKGQTDD